MKAFLIALFLLPASQLLAQTVAEKFDLYEQTSEVAGLIIRYRQDLAAIQHFYSSKIPNRGYSTSIKVLNSPEQRKRFTELDKAYLAQLDKLDFKAMSIHGKVDLGRKDYS